jgi:chemotaxis protein methyltransferase CheR
MNISMVALGPEQFQAVSELVRQTCGIHLHGGKLELVRARLASRLRELRLADFDSYLALLDADQGGRELTTLVDLLTTNKTSFFREPRHFDLLRERLVPELYARGRALRVWSAGCSTGEEPYSLAIVLRHELGSPTEARILATDISTRALARAREAIYTDEQIDAVPPAFRRTAFRCVRQEPPRSYAVDARLRSMVHFARLNLNAHWPMRGPFDLICCRNVMIYFARETQQALVQRFWQLLRPGGYFLAGHSESFAALEHRFEYVQPAVYRRPA